MEGPVGDGAKAKQKVPLSSTGIRKFLAGRVRIGPPERKNDTVGTRTVTNPFKS